MKKSDRPLCKMIMWFKNMHTCKKKTFMKFKSVHENFKKVYKPFKIYLCIFFYENVWLFPKSYFVKMKKKKGGKET